MKKTITIIGSQASMWYNNLIGHRFEVTDLPGEDHYQYEGQKIIFKSDCII